jgi:hypothetical protein
MVCGQVLGLLFAAQTLGPTWGQSVPASPCPDVFQYQVDSSGNWRGLINIPAPQPGYIFRTTVELAINAVLPAVSFNYLHSYFYKATVQILHLTILVLKRHFTQNLFRIKYLKMSIDCHIHTVIMDDTILVNAV